MREYRCIFSHFFYIFGPMRLEEEIKQKEFTNDYHKGIVNILYTFNWLDSQSKDFFKKYDLTPQQYNILRILRGQSPKPSTINLLKDRMLDKMCDASRIVERLRLKNLLERTQCPNDRRSVDIVISQKGLNLLSMIDKDLERFYGIMHHLNKDEMQQLNDLLDKLRG
jgi:DNA-binding MarR family transcriptional regulator